ncbi:MAG: hypothetical protein IPP57_07260 [Candidatus Obscuribacter sp.]|jgi:hypothetical protein|nr:hypothetical protein [Candidatus Obscuribacter sp.]MDQ5966995.1 hypothetical protein [Cyanobacteriota bacterium erpe_2018_sw_39hr_WHONDRS-SW48-000098_B_bin.30]MBK7840441.1 hypothetical protein [Candidatus Obscuribacter sp.]MBK9201635.1 hypothetical protein [Candidatus Obscuribacter sp.]MBK9619936.1 hypothetical protein [Candidatus Obscuribacter sp.]
MSTATAPANTVMDTALLDEVVHWVKTLTAVGVSPDTAATITTEILLAANSEENHDHFWGDEDEDEDEE